MGHAIERLHRAIEYGLLSSISGSAERKGALYGRFAACLTTQGSVNDADSIVSLPNFEAFQHVLPILVEVDGRKSVHTIWDDDEFIAPAIAALAMFMDATANPKGNTMFTLTVQPDNDALYGYRLTTFTAAPLVGEGEMTAKQWTQASIFLCGAALAFFNETSMMRFAPYFLHATVTGEIPDDAQGLSNLKNRIIVAQP